MKLLLRTTDRGPPLNSQKSSSHSGLLKCGRSGAKTLAPAQVLLTKLEDVLVQKPGNDTMSDSQTSTFLQLVIIAYCRKFSLNRAQ